MHHSGSFVGHLPCFGRSPPPCRQPRAERTCRGDKPCSGGGSALQGHIRQRGPSGTWEYILDVGVFAAQRCESCGRRFWVERKPSESCPFCRGELREAEERRRETKAGFASRKECQAALTAQAHHPGRAHLRATQPPQPAGVPAQGLAAGDRERRKGNDTVRLSHAGLAAPRAAAGSGAAAEPERRPDQRPLRQAAREGRVHGCGGLSPNTVHHVHAVLHRALRDAVKWGYLQTNAAACADPPRASAQHRELPVWSEEQLHAFLDSVADQRLYPLWRFLAMTGCRRGEALGLTWRDLDIEGGRVAIRRALVPIDGKLRRDRAQDQARATADRTRCRDGGGAETAGRPAAGRATGAG